MADKKNRYLVYYFDRDAMADLEAEGLDEEEVFEPRNIGFVTQFGELVFHLMMQMKLSAKHQNIQDHFMIIV